MVVFVVFSSVVSHVRVVMFDGFMWPLVGAFLSVFSGSRWSRFLFGGPCFKLECCHMLPGRVRAGTFDLGAWTADELGPLSLDHYEPSPLQ